MGVKRVSAAAAACMFALLAAACGADVDDSSNGGSASDTSAVPVDETINVEMADIKFKPDTLTVRAGTTVRFVFDNTGDLDHEAAFGDEATQQAVASGRQKRVGPLVGPNGKKDWVQRFDAPGSLIIGCHVAGHYEAGMKIRVTIA
jgi:uncharacterized cupredoxin-like copper-binding protein